VTLRMARWILGSDDMESLREVREQIVNWKFYQQSNPQRQPVTIGGGRLGWLVFRNYGDLGIGSMKGLHNAINFGLSNAA